MRYLVIAEKAEVAKAIDKAIRNSKYGQKDEYKVTAASGHLFALKAPEEYDEKYAKWSFEDLPIAFRNWDVVPKKDTQLTNGMYQKKISLIKEGLDWCDQVIHAGDPDDEGQLIVDEILDFFGNKKPVLRLDVNDSTEQYIVKMLGQMTDNKSMKAIGRSAYARTVADAMFGFNFTRYYTMSYGTRSVLSVGRVQTPTLGLVVNRDRQIESHVQQLYYVMQIKGTAPDGKTISFTFEPKKDLDIFTDGKVLDKHAYDPIIQEIDGKAFPATIQKKTLFDNPPLPFNLVELQSYCSKKFGLSPDQTHKITQSLRAYALITYNRSSCQYLHEFQHGEAPGVIKSVFANLGITAPVDYSIKSKCFNDKYLEGEPHHAIIPTQSTADISKLTADERNVYEAICKYYIAQFLPPKEKLQTSATIERDDGRLISKSIKIINPGFSSFLKNENKEDQEKEESSVLDDFAEGQTRFTLSEPNIKEEKTNPPSRYTQASLIKDMTCIAKYVQDPVIKQLLIDKDSDKQKENGSIGTPATRDGIIRNLISRGYIQEVGSAKKSHIESTELGRSFYDALPDELKSADITAEWWKLTQDIRFEQADENVLFDKLLKQINDFLSEKHDLKEIKGIASPEKKIIGKCPKCGHDVAMGKTVPYCTGKCGMMFGKIYGKIPTEAQYTKLINNQKVHMTGLTGSSGKTFAATVVPGGISMYNYTNKENQNVVAYGLNFTLEFEDNSLGKCLKCGENVKAGPNGAYCTGKCGMFYGKAYGKKLTDNQIKSLLNGKKITLRGIKSKRTGKEFDAYVTLDKGYQEQKYMKDGVEKTICLPNYKMEFIPQKE